MQTFVRQLYDAFGPQRMFWGTDITRMPCSWRQCVTMFTEELRWLAGRDQELVMGRAVFAWLEWKRPGVWGARAGHRRAARPARPGRGLHLRAGRSGARP